MIFNSRTPRKWFNKFKAIILPDKGYLRPWIYMCKRMLRLNASTHDLAMGVAVGIFGGINPIYGIQMITAAVLAILLRGNMLVAMAATWVANPLTYPFFWYGCWFIGYIVLDKQMPDSAFPEINWADLTEGWREIAPILTKMLAGYPIFAGVLSILSYFITFFIIKKVKSNKKSSQKKN